MSKSQPGTGKRSEGGRRVGTQRRSVCKNFQAAGNGSSAELRGDWNAPRMNKHGVFKCQAAHFWVCVCVSSSEQVSLESL